MTSNQSQRNYRKIRGRSTHLDKTDDQVLLLEDESSDQPINLNNPVSLTQSIQTSQSSKSHLSENNDRQHLLLLGLIFIIALFILCIIYILFPKIEESERDAFRIPKTIDDAKVLGDVLYKYSKHHYYIVMLAFFTSYIFLQTFAIPGSIFLSILAGFLYPFPLALFLVCLCSSVGASFCYLLSHIFGRRIIWKYFRARISDWQKKVQQHSDSLLWFMIFLRITPLLPNWFVNVSSPILNFPLGKFFAGTFAGVALPSILFIQAGKTLHQLTSASDVLSWRSIVVLGVFAVLSLLPIKFKDYLRKKMGVNNFWSILEPACKQGNNDDLNGKTVAVDLSIWICECRSIVSKTTPFQKNSMHLRILFFRVLNMIYFNIKPIFVLDSTKITGLKLNTVIKRINFRHNKKITQQSDTLITSKSDTRSHFNIFVNECCQLLNYLGIPIIRADGEAEKLCAQLNRMNIVDAVITNDSDCFVYGANRIIRNFSIDVKSTSFEMYDIDEIIQTCELNHRSFLTLALLLGCDYDSQGVIGVGREIALKYLKLLPKQCDPVDYLMQMVTDNQTVKVKNKYEQRILSCLQSSNKQQYQLIIDEYTSPIENVNMISSIANIKWLRPVQLKQLEEYMKKKLDWPETYTYSKVLPLITRFQMLYKLNMIMLDDDNDRKHLNYIQPLCIRKIRVRQRIEHYEIEWRQEQTLEQQIATLNMSTDNDEEEEDNEKLITIEPCELFRLAYENIVKQFNEKQKQKKKKSNKKQTTIKNDSIIENSVKETPIKKLSSKKIIQRYPKSEQYKNRSSSAIMSTSMSLEMLNIMYDDQEKMKPLTKKLPQLTKMRTIEHNPKSIQYRNRPTTAALSTSISFDMLNIMRTSTDGKHKSKEKPIIRKKIIHRHPKSELNNINGRQTNAYMSTSMSLDMLNILKSNQYDLFDDDECEIIKIVPASQDISIIVKVEESDDEQNEFIPLPLWDRLRQRRVNDNASIIDRYYTQNLD